ncbi:MAG: hypothetical protein EWV91_13025 [Microcystis aeruginosa Ma_QC_Ca_00000000_S207]|uniref:Uncharacterized protein n=1 Tax=Microcystis aeruginosa Ma_QC_Ca_00000000_S207 TaxID=2486251 RepID=A0A552FHR4_MICAE|nr:MAG: hypothetical protein EWV91_13025 [Microcystis aeruginosa Ma_QC_Ca_00000000_S207]
MRLYRGDFIENLTEPGLYRIDGIRSKTFGRGDPYYIDKNSLIEAIRQHTEPNSPVDIDYYNKTDFISFTTERKRAMYWASAMGKISLVNCDIDYFETHYIFTIDIEEEKLIKINEGIYFFEYACNPLLKQPNSPYILDYPAVVPTCPICQGLKSNHSLYLIDSVEFLNRHSDSEKYKGAFENAIRDKEWLLLPNDSINHGRSARIPRADFWSVTHFMVEGKPRDPFRYSIRGIID